MTPKLPGLLVRHIQQKRCVVFVGAGLSAGAGLPTWGRLLLNGIQELVGALLDGELHQKELEQLVKQGKLLEVADFCKEKLGSAYHQFLSEQVRGDQARLPPTHDVLMRLPFSAWVTTNYDKLLERAYSKVKGGGFPKTLTHKDTEALGRLLFDGGQFILKAHGDIDRPETVVLTSRDYSEIIHANPAFNEIFSGLLLTKALFFVGYSLSDPDFRLLMDRQLTHFKGFVPERYALMTGVGPVERDVLWRTARIQIISYENASGTHAEVLQFLQALEAELLPKSALESMPVLESMPPPRSVPAPAAAPQTKQAVPYNVSVGSRPGSPSPGSRVAELFLFTQDDELTAPVSGPASQPPARAPQAPRALPHTPHRLYIDSVGGKLQLRLVRGDERPEVQWSAPTRMSVEQGLAVMRDLAKGPSPKDGFYTHHLRWFFQEYLPREMLEALAEEGPSSQAPLVLHLAPVVAHFPWELLLLRGEPVCLQRRLVRAPVGIPAQVRGVPKLRSEPRILLIDGGGAAHGSGKGELERLAALYPASGVDLVRLQGGEATFRRIMEEMRAERDDELPDLVHYTGKLLWADYQLFLQLPDGMGLSAGALRSVLSRGRLPLLVMNAPSSAFGLSSAGVQERWMGLADQQGVGAFVGTFGSLNASTGADFMVTLHRALITGLPIADAVLQARREVHAARPDDPTALQYVLSGNGNLQLANSQRE